MERLARGKLSTRVARITSILPIIFESCSYGTTKSNPHLNCRLKQVEEAIGLWPSPNETMSLVTKEKSDSATKQESPRFLKFHSFNIHSFVDSHALGIAQFHAMRSHNTGLSTGKALDMCCVLHNALAGNACLDICPTNCPISARMRHNT